MDKRIETLYKRCLNKNSKVNITPTLISMTFETPFSVYCNYFVDAKEKDPPSEFYNLLAEEGLKHEKQVVENLYPEAKKMAYKTPEEGFKLVLEAMFDGISSITQAPLYYYPEGFSGIADILEKRSGKSVFGGHYYIVKEIKSAKNIKPKHIVQAAVYNYMLGHIQGRIPEEIEIINRDEELIGVKYSKIEPILLKACKDLEEIVEGRLVPTPNWNSRCYPWDNYSNKKAIESKDVSLVNKIGPSKKQELAVLGITTVKDLLDCPEEQLLEIDGIAEATLQKIKNSAKAINSGKHFIISKEWLKFPITSDEIFLDIESTMENEEVPKINYLIGCLIRDKGKETLKYFVCESLGEEEQMWKEFQKWLVKQVSFTIYYWSSYERTAFNHLNKLYGCNKNVWKILNENMKDLKMIAEKSVSFPTYGMSIKQVAPYCGFKWRRSDVNAVESIALYLKYLNEGDKETLKKILDYNEDDLMATKTVKDWLAKI